MAIAVADPSNRVYIHPQNHPDIIQPQFDVGIDKLSVSFPIKSFSKDKMLWDEVWAQSARVHDRSGGAPFTIRVNRRYGGLRCWMEFNPSRIPDPYGFSLCRPEDVFSTVRQMLHQVQGRMDFDGDVGDMSVTRIDLARDFRVIDPQFFITGLLNLARPYAKTSCVYYGAKTGAAESLYVGTSKGIGAKRPNHVKIYDKGLQTGLSELRGLLRWEVEARTWAETYGDINALADLTPERIQALALNRWKWSRMGEVVVGREGFVDRAFAAQWSSEAVRDRFIGQSVGLIHGKLVLDPKSHEVFSKRQQVLGISLSDRPGVAKRLDFETGTEVLAEADISIPS